MSRARAAMPVLAAAAAKRQAVDAEIDEEFALHLDLLERELIDSGADPAEARRLAVARFGDPEPHRARCRRIALKEQIIMERLKTVLLVLFGLAIIVLVVLLVGAIGDARRYQQLAVMTRAMLEEQRAAPSVLPVYINTGVAHPGPYALQDDKTTLRRMIIAAGGLTPTAGAEIVVVHTDGTTETILGPDLANPTGPDITLRPGDRIEIR